MSYSVVLKSQCTYVYTLLIGSMEIVWLIELYIFYRTIIAFNNQYTYHIIMYIIIYVHTTDMARDHSILVE